MILKRIKYSEYKGKEKEWVLEEIVFSKANLIVGENSTGKSRTISLIGSIGSIISGQLQEPFESGDYEIEIENDKNSYTYSINFEDNIVSHEKLTVNGIVKLSRNSEGFGSIFYHVENKFIEFKIPKNLIAINQRKDNLQHPYLEDFIQWGKELSSIRFGTSLGKSNAMPLSTAAIVANKPKELLITVNIPVIEKYIIGYKQFAKKFDDEIINIMSVLGYELNSVGCEPFELNNINFNEQLVCLYVNEKDLGFNVFSNNMSQGMYRALVVAIDLSFALLENKQATILIDDIGEGLDFRRSSNLVKFIIEKVQSSDTKLQVIMTSNDHFVMNCISLDYWIILKRYKKHVKSITKYSHPDVFDEFSFVGLNNFEFFSSNFFEHGFSDEKDSDIR